MIRMTYLDARRFCVYNMQPYRIQRASNRQREKPPTTDVQQVSCYNVETHQNRQDQGNARCNHQEVNPP